MKNDVSGDNASVISREDKHVSGEKTNTVMNQERVSQETRVKESSEETQTGVLDDPEVNRLYTPLSVAKEEIWKRWNNKELKKEVEAFLGNDIPECFQNGPRVVLVRHIVSPNREAVHFLRIAKQVNLQPLFVEYLSDKFVAENIDKYYLAKLFFYNGIGKHDGEHITSCKIVDIAAEDGNNIRDINTVWGESLADFHHRMFREIMIPEHSFFDMSLWFATHGGKAKDYYIKYLALFLCHSVLAEVFLTYNRKENGFIDTVFAPAVDQLEALFGIKPLMIPLFHLENEKRMDDNGKEWMQYPEFMKQFIPNEVKK